MHKYYDPEQQASVIMEKIWDKYNLKGVRRWTKDDDTFYFIIDKLKNVEMCGYKSAFIEGDHGD